MANREKKHHDYTVLIIDDDESIRQTMTMILDYEGYRTVTAADGPTGIDLFWQVNPDAVMLDIKMPGMDGLEVLESLAAETSTPIIMISGHGTIETALQATRLGAFDFLEKPLEKDIVLLTLRNALSIARLEHENRQYRERDAGHYIMIGDSSPMREVKALIERAAPTSVTVLITGESGTGKELVARAIHQIGRGQRYPFVQVNCAAIPEELIENELFGHEKGSYTGASALQRGKFEQARGGTIFLDEIGDMSLKTQAKVLRVLQEREFQRVGGTTLLRSDARVVAASNKRLPHLIQSGQFREDLFFRLNVIPLAVPPLRDRREDIPFLVEHFIGLICQENGFRRKTMTGEAVSTLQHYHWPGNVRELKNLIERLVILTPGDMIDRKDISDFSVQLNVKSSLPFDPRVCTLKQFKDLSERYYIVQRLRENAWNIQKTAEVIDTPRSNLYRKLEQYEISEEKDG